uniref:Intraflagellar transport protein 46 homolog n=1 Tax=Cyprinus carpio carpio TaxID=630221 RepID=A0A9J8AEB3_CYPCA
MHMENQKSTHILPVRTQQLTEETSLVVDLHSQEFWGCASCSTAFTKTITAKGSKMAEVQMRGMQTKSMEFIRKYLILKRPMPDTDSLMQEWPPEFEELLGKVNLPTADIDCDLVEYVNIMCGENSTVNRGNIASGGLTLAGVLGLCIVFYCLYKNHHSQRVKMAEIQMRGMQTKSMEFIRKYLILKR